MPPDPTVHASKKESGAAARPLPDMAHATEPVPGGGQLGDCSGNFRITSRCGARRLRGRVHVGRRPDNPSHPWPISGDAVGTPLDGDGGGGDGEALSEAIGATIGIAGGVELAVYTAVLPGIRPVIALGLLGGALLGLAGAEAGGELDKVTTDGLPEGEFLL
jgi:hypothetical protein